MKRDYTEDVMAYLGPLENATVVVKSSQEYMFSSWLTEMALERDAMVPAFGVLNVVGFLVVKPRLVGPASMAKWYALMYAHEFLDLLQQAVKGAGQEIRLWHQEMRGNSISTMISKMLKLAEVNRVDSGATHSCVHIDRKRDKGHTLSYVCLTLGQMADLLVRAGYGRRDDQAGA